MQENNELKFVEVSEEVGHKLLKEAEETQYIVCEGHDPPIYLGRHKPLYGQEHMEKYPDCKGPYHCITRAKI